MEKHQERKRAIVLSPAKTHRESLWMFLFFKTVNMKYSTGISPEQMDEIMKQKYVDYAIHIMYDAIRLNFPNIKNLVVTENSITFDAMEYTKEDVEQFINSLQMGQLFPM